MGRERNFYGGAGKRPGRCLRQNFFRNVENVKYGGIEKWELCEIANKDGISNEFAGSKNNFI
jgi:hypothetical protein